MRQIPHLEHEGPVGALPRRIAAGLRVRAVRLAQRGQLGIICSVSAVRVSEESRVDELACGDSDQRHLSD